MGESPGFCAKHDHFQCPGVRPLHWPPKRQQTARCFPIQVFIVSFLKYVLTSLLPCRLVGKKKEDGSEMNKWFSSTFMLILFTDTISNLKFLTFYSCPCWSYSLDTQGSPVCHWSWIVQRNLLEQHTVRFILLLRWSSSDLFIFWVFYSLRIESKRYYELKVILIIGNIWFLCLPIDCCRNLTSWNLATAPGSMCYFMRTAESEDPPSDLVPVQPDNKYSATTNLSMILREDIKKPVANF